MNKINKNNHDFYLSNTEPCPYLTNRDEKKIFLIMNDINKSNEYEFLIKNGFRRSHNILYNQVCANCNLCKSIRINVKKLSESPTEEQFLLFKKYLKFKHYDSEMNEMNFDDYCKMFNAPGISTKVYEYYNQKYPACSCNIYSCWYCPCIWF